MKEIRGPLPLSDADFDEIRARVMAKIARKERRGMWRFAFATIALAIVVYFAIPARVPSLPSGAAATPPPRGDVVVAAPEEVAPRKTVPMRRRGRRRPTEPAVARMEIQTSDPDIRIIWIAN